LAGSETTPMFSKAVDATENHLRLDRLHVLVGQVTVVTLLVLWRLTLRKCLMVDASAAVCLSPAKMVIF